MKILDGKSLSNTIKEEIAAEVARIKTKGGKIPHLAVIMVGHNPASDTYVANKVNSCEKIGFQSSLIRFDETVEENELLNMIEEINNNDDIDGLIVQLPLPKHISVERVAEKIKPEKDVDGFNPVNIGKMVSGLPTYVSATPYGIMQLFEQYHIETAGKHCVILGRSNIVGKPMSILMARKAYPGNCTVTICHSRTENLKDFSKSADILIVALGKPEFVTENMVKEGAVVIDVGITRVKDATKKSGFALKGDVKFDEVAKKCSYITPVPGGVGPMTVTALLMNTLKAAKLAIGH